MGILDKLVMEVLFGRVIFKLKCEEREEASQVKRNGKSFPCRVANKCQVLDTEKELGVIQKQLSGLTDP